MRTFPARPLDELFEELEGHWIDRASIDETLKQRCIAILLPNALELLGRHEVELERELRDRAFDRVSPFYGACSLL